MTSQPNANLQTPQDFLAPEAANPSPAERSNADLDKGDQNSTPSSEALADGSETDQANAIPFQEDSDIIPVIGLGGSAGSLAPLQEFFAVMKPNTGMAFVVVLHLAPDYESALPQLLQARTSMPVTQVRERTLLQPNHVYVIPPARNLSLQDGHLQLSEPERPRGRHVAVDLFFRTLAATHRSRAVAVVLSGADSDGAIGIKRVKEHGGVTVAQDPAEAEYDGMPRAAIATGMIDWVLPIEEMAAKLAEFAINEERIQIPPPEGEMVRPIEEPREETALREILAFLLARTGHDFSHYKRPTVLRRIARRLQVNSLDTLPNYVAYLRTHPGEAGALLQDLLISVTNFFRDPDSFDALSAYIPQLFLGRKPGDTIRVWVPGCATGEEAYSLAMMLIEHADKLNTPVSIQVFATDIDEEATRVARDGLYPTTIAADVSPERLRRFFVSEGNSYRMKKEVREVVLFASHNLLRDSPFSRLDLVSCRNLLIYFNAAAQERVFEVFHFALRSEGLLFLGGAESADDTGALFTTLDKKHHVFRRRPVPRPNVPMLPVPSGLPLSQGLTSGVSRPRVRPLSLSAQTEVADVMSSDVMSSGELHLRLLEQLAPPSILVDEEYNIIHLSEHAGRYLRVPSGEMSNNLLTMVSPALRLELRAALFRATQNGQQNEVPAVPLHVEGQERVVSVQVRLITEGQNQLFLVVFTEGGEAIAPSSTSPAEESVARRLEEELQASKRHLRATVEQYEASTEELKASNEELQAVNEELQAAGEELETSREELQATNEELTTVNQELKAKVEEVSRSNSDLRNLMVSTDIATLFLDRQLSIKRYTPRVTELFRLIPADTGRPLSDLRHSLMMDEGALEADCVRVLEYLAPIEREVRTLEGHEFVLRILPYRTAEDRIDGVVLTFVDITERKLTEAALRESENRFRVLVTATSDAIYRMNADWTEMLNLHGSEFLDDTESPSRVWLQKYILPEERSYVMENVQRARDAKIPFELEHRVIRTDGSEGWTFSRAIPILDDNGEILEWFGTATDVTVRREAQDVLRRSREELEALVAGRSAELFRSEARFSGAFRFSPVAMTLTTRAEDRFVDVNQAAQEFLGQTREELLGRTFVEVGEWQWPVLGTLDNQGTRRAYQEQLNETGSVHNVEMIFKVGDGLPRVALSSAVVLPDGSADEDLLLTMLVDISAQRASEEAREQLLRRLVSVLEDERRRISRELHDQMGQKLNALMLGLKVLPDAPQDPASPPAINERIIGLQDITASLMEDTRRLAWDLRPASLDTLGLEAALRQHLREWQDVTGISTELETHQLTPQMRLRPDLETAFYRIAQEALTNVTRHAQAQRVSVLLQLSPQHLIMTVEDNGQGFTPVGEEGTDPVGGGGRLGLLGMRERAEAIDGIVRVESVPGEGTTVYVRAPLQEREAGHNR